MRPSVHTYVVALVGARHPEFIRLERLISARGWPVRLVDGGHISEGSNARRAAERAANGADLVLWNPNGSRKFGGGFIPHLAVKRIHGVSSAADVLAAWLAQREATPAHADAG
jgi:hypothetical protein